MTKKEIIREIIMAVNANADRTKNYPFPAKKADGDLFFHLAFRTEKELIEICQKTGIRLF